MKSITKPLSQYTKTMKTIIFLSFFLLSLPLVYSQENQHLSLEGKWPYGVSYTMEMKGDIVFTTDGGMLQIYDFSNIATPVLLSEIFSANLVYDLRIIENRAYVASYEGSLIIFDISDLSNPQKLGEVETVEGLNSVDVKGNYAYLASHENGFTIVDVADAKNPAVVNHMNLGSNLHKVLVHENHVFISGLDFGIAAYSLDNPVIPFFVSSFDTISYEPDMEVIGNRLYAASSGNGILILDISDVSDIKFISFSGTSHHPISIDVEGLTALVCEYDHGFTLFDLTDETDPNIYGQFSAPSVSRKALLKGQNVIISGLFTLLSTDVSSPLQINELHRINFHGFSRYLDKWGNSLFVAGLNDIFFTYPIRVLDVSNPEQPVEAPLSLPSVSDAAGLYAADGLLFVSENGWIKIIDVQDVSQPVVYDSIWSGMGNSLVLKHNNLLFTNTYNSLIISDLTDLNNVVQVGSISEDITSMDAQGHYLIIGTSSDFSIYDIANPANPQKIFNKPLFSTKSVAWNNDRIFLLVRNMNTTNKYCLAIFNASDLSNIFSETSFSCNLSDGSIAVEDNFLYVSDWDYGLLMYDISNPLLPELCGYYPRIVPILTFKVRSPFVYLPISQGVEILRNDLLVYQDDYFLPAEVRLKLYPNPATEKIVFNLQSFDPKTDLSYKVADMHGKTILSGKVMLENVELNIAELPRSVYYLQVEKDRQFYKAALFVKQ